jgi:adenine-specific DNA glycosylase
MACKAASAVRGADRRTALAHTTTMRRSASVDKRLRRWLKRAVSIHETIDASTLHLTVRGSESGLRFSFKCLDCGATVEHTQPPSSLAPLSQEHALVETETHCPASRAARIQPTSAAVLLPPLPLKSRVLLVLLPLPQPMI